MRSAAGGSDTTWVRGGSVGGTVPLSGLDLLVRRLHVRRLLFYERTLDPARLRDSLAQALADYPLLAGQFDARSLPLAVRCTDRGVRFTVARSARTVRSLISSSTRQPDVEEFLDDSDRLRTLDPSVPVLSVRLTRLAGGGSVVCVSNPHCVTDGAGIYDFLQAWSKRARGERHPAPSHDRNAFDALGENDGAASDDNMTFRRLGGLEKIALVCRLGWQARRNEGRVVRFTATELRAMKQEATADPRFEEQPVSTQDLLGAFLWRAAALAKDGSGSSSYCFVHDLRRKSGLAIPPRYFGNAFIVRGVSASLEELRGSSLLAIAQRIRRISSSIRDEEVAREIALLAGARDRGRASRLVPRFVPDCLRGGMFVNNWSRFPIYDIDFGTGGPAWFDVALFPLRWMATIVPAPERDGGCDVHLVLPRGATGPFLDRPVNVTGVSSRRVTP